MLTQQRVQEVKSNNMANLNTTGHKRDMSVKSEFSNMLISRINDPENIGPPQSPQVDNRPYIGELGTGVLLDETVKDFSQGPLKETGNTLDLGLEGDGFFTVNGPDGEEYFTRSGALTLSYDETSEEATLVTLQGDPVLGEEGIIQLSGEKDITVTENGAIYQGQDDEAELIDNLALVNFENPQGLARYGDNLLEQTEESGAPQELDLDGEDFGILSVHQGKIESSNVNSVDEMTGMINALRAYESNQRAIQGHDDTLERAVNDIGRPVT